MTPREDPQCGLCPCKTSARACPAFPHYELPITLTFPQYQSPQAYVSIRSSWFVAVLSPIPVTTVPNLPPRDSWQSSSTVSQWETRNSDFFLMKHTRSIWSTDTLKDNYAIVVKKQYCRVKVQLKVWLRPGWCVSVGWSIMLYTERSQVQVPVGIHAWVAGLVPGCRFGPPVGARIRQLINVSLSPSLSLYSPLSLKSISMSSGEDKKNFDLAIY